MMLRILLCLLATNVVFAQDDQLERLGYSSTLSKSVDPITRQELQQGPDLGTLNLDGAELTAADVALIVKKHPKLAFLTLRAARIERNGYQHLQELKELVSLDLAEVDELDSSVLEEVAKIPRLQILSLDKWYNLRSEDLKAIREKTTLTFIDLSYCIRLDSSVLDYIPMSVQVLSFLGCVQMESSWLENIQKLSNLRSLDLSKTCLGVQAYLNVAHSKTIKTLFLWDSLGLDDQGLMALAKIPELKQLDLSHAYQLTDRGLAFFLEKAGKSLVTLHLSDCFQLGDKAAIACGKYCPSLQSLDFYGCYRLSDRAVTEGFLKLKSLSYLNIEHCPHISSEARQRLLQTLGIPSGE